MTSAVHYGFNYRDFLQRGTITDRIPSSIVF